MRDDRRWLLTALLVVSVGLFLVVARSPGRATARCPRSVSYPWGYIAAAAFGLNVVLVSALGSEYWTRLYEQIGPRWLAFRLRHSPGFRRLWFVWLPSAFYVLWLTVLVIGMARCR